MRKFIVDAKNTGVEGLYCADSSASNIMFNEGSNPAFGSMGVTYGAQIDVDSTKSLKVGENASWAVATPTLTNYGISFILQIVYGTVFIFYSQSSDGMLWGVCTNSNNNALVVYYGLNGVQQSASIPCDTSKNYIAYQRIDKRLTFTVNSQVYSYDCDATSFTTIYAGPFTGYALMNDIAISSTGKAIPIETYTQLFRNNSLESIYRRGDKGTVKYLKTDTFVKTLVATDQDFQQLPDGYKYYAFAGYENTTSSILMFDKTFPLDLMGNDGVYTTFSSGFPFARLFGYQQAVLRHKNFDDQDYTFEVLQTTPYVCSLPGITSTVTTGVILAREEDIDGFYSTKGYDTALAGINFAADVGTPIRSVELLGNFTDAYANIKVLGGNPTGTLYVNGVVGTPPNDQSHCVFVFDADQTVFSLNAPSRLAGVGYSDVAYTAAEVKRLYDTFVGNSSIVTPETLGQLQDGVLSDGPVNALTVRWAS